MTEPKAHFLNQQFLLYVLIKLNIIDIHAGEEGEKLRVRVSRIKVPQYTPSASELFCNSL